MVLPWCFFLLLYNLKCKQILTNEVKGYKVSNAKQNIGEKKKHIHRTQTLLTSTDQDWVIYEKKSLYKSDLVVGGEAMILFICNRLKTLYLELVKKTPLLLIFWK